MTVLRFSAVCLAAIGCAAVSLALPLGLWNTGAPAPGLFPFVAAVLLLITSFAVAVCKDTQSREDEPADHVRLLHYGAAIASFAIAIKFLGMTLATVFLVAGILRWIERKSWTQALMAAVGLAVLSWWVFDLLLGVPLPRGVLEIG